VTYHFGYNGNGNVGQLVNAADGAIVAHYEYDPYGNTIFADGDYADDNIYRFSTKYFDVEIGLYYYGYRYYSADLGRWISQDPLEENGGVNLYCFTLNAPVFNIDSLGEFAWKDLAFTSVGWDRSGNIPPGGMGFPVGLGGCTIQKFIRAQNHK